MAEVYYVMTKVCADCRERSCDRGSLALISNVSRTDGALYTLWPLNACSRVCLLSLFIYTNASIQAWMRLA